MITEIVEHDRLLERAHEIADIVNSNAPLAVRGTRLAIHKTLDLPLLEGEILAETFRERVLRTEDALEGPLAFMEKRTPNWQCRYGMPMSLRNHPARPGSDRPRRDHHAQPARGAELVQPDDVRGDGEAWRIVKLDEAINAVVLRAAGERAFSAGLDVKSRTASLTTCGTTRIPVSCSARNGRRCGSRWSAPSRACARRARSTSSTKSDVVICSTDATFFDSHVSAGLVSALEPIGLMRRVGLGDTLRMALMGNDERVGAETALRIGLVTEVVARRTTLGRELTTSPRPSPPSRRPPPRAPSRRSGNRWTSPTARQWTRDSSTPGWAIRSPRPSSEPAQTQAALPSNRGSADAHTHSAAHRRRARTGARCTGHPVRGPMATGHSIDEAAHRIGRSPKPEVQVGIMLRNGPAHVAALLGVLQSGGTRRGHQPSRGDTAQSRHRRPAAAVDHRGFQTMSRSW